jgi:hypothetical protein
MGRFVEVHTTKEPDEPFDDLAHKDEEEKGKHQDLKKERGVCEPVGGRFGNRELSSVRP